MRKSLILIGDMLAVAILICWCRLGLWINLLGFSLYHSRGDVWLPTPPPAIDFLMGMVLDATILLATSFLLISLLIFLAGRCRDTDKAGPWHFLHDAFYGDARKLLVKYSVLLLGLIILPLAVSSMWRIRPSHQFAILTGSGIMLVAFIVIAFAADILVARTRPQPVSASNLGVTI
jgi:hypothetical protein